MNQMIYIFGIVDSSGGVTGSAFQMHDRKG